MPYSIELGPDGNVNRVLEDDTVALVDIAKPHTAMADFDAEIPYDRAIDDNALDRVRIYSNGKLLFRGYLKELDWNESRGRVRMNGPGIADDLRDSAIERGWTNTATHRAIRQVWDQDTGFNATVRDPSVNEIVTAQALANASTTSELDALIDTLPATAPVVAQNGILRTGQSAYYREGENYDFGFGAGEINDPGLSDGGAEDIFDPIHDPGWTIDTEYDIPGGDWEVWVLIGSYTGKFWDSFDFNYYGNGFDIDVDGQTFGGAGDSFGFGYIPQDTIPRFADSAVLDDGGSQTDYTSEFNDDTADDVPLLPSSPSTGDAFYVGHEGAFDTLELDISTPASGTYSVTWEYYAKEMNDDGSDFDTSDDTVVTEEWRPIPNVNDGTNGFRQSGNVEWDLADIQDDTQDGGDYTRMSDDGGPNANDRFVRARVTSFSSLSTQPLARQGWPWAGMKTWLNVGGGSSTLEAGSHDIQFTNVADSGFITLIDGIALVDSRFNYDFPELPNTYNGYLDGPQAFPDGYQFQLDQFETEFNVIGIDLTTSGWPDTTGDQQVAVSFDGGATWFTADNATSISEDLPSNVGKTVDTRLTLDRYGTRDTATPRKGYQAQEVTDIDIAYDGSDLSVIVDNTYRGSPLKILKDLHEKAGYRFVIDHAATDGNGNLVKEVESFETGTETRSKDWSTTNRSPKRSFVDYANEVTVYGALGSDGTRPKAVVEDTDEVNQYGREPYFEILPDLETVDQVRNAALDILTNKVQERTQKGTVKALPTTTLPGFDYPVDWFRDGNPIDTPLERVQFRESADQLDATLKFVRDDDVTGTVIEQGRAIDRTRTGI